MKGVSISTLLLQSFAVLKFWRAKPSAYRRKIIPIGLSIWLKVKQVSLRLRLHQGLSGITIYWIALNCLIPPRG